MPSDTPQTFILASASPRRLALLEQAGIRPDRVLAAEIDEAPRKDERPGALAGRLALAKAALVATHSRGAFVLGADTVVARGRRILGKPVDEAAARRYLGLLSGCRHRVYGAISVVAPDGHTGTRLVRTFVTFKHLGAGEIEAYLASEEWQGKAGAYAIQGRAAAFVRRINGSYTNVVGLPLFETAQLLAGLGYGAAREA